MISNTVPKGGKTITPKQTIPQTAIKITPKSKTDKTKTSKYLKKMVKQHLPNFNTLESL